MEKMVQPTGGTMLYIAIQRVLPFILLKRNIVSRQKMKKKTRFLELPENVIPI